MKRLVHVAALALLVAVGVLVGAGPSYAAAGDPSQWVSVAGDPSQWVSVAGDPSQWG
jgi:uncharacterized protein YciI